MDIEFVQASRLLSPICIFAQVIVAVGFAAISSVRFIHPLRKVILAIGLVIFSQSVIWNTAAFIGGILVPHSGMISNPIFNLLVFLGLLQAACAMAAGTFILADCRIVNRVAEINPEGYSGRLIRKLDIKRSENETYDICKISWAISEKIVWTKIVFFPLKYTYKALAFVIRPIYRCLRQKFMEKGWNEWITDHVEDVPWTPISLAVLLGTTYLLWGRHEHLVWFSALGAIVVTVWTVFHFAPLFAYRCTDRIYTLFFKPGSQAEHVLVRIGKPLKPLGKAAIIGYANFAVLFNLAKRIKRGACPLVDIKNHT